MMETKPYNLIAPKDLGKNTTINLQVCENEVDMYWRGAIDVLEVISANNAKGEPTVMVVPYGPLGPYARLVYLVNKYRISLKNCIFINMDEYLENETEYISENDPLSFRGGMDRIFYSQIDEELTFFRKTGISPTPGTRARCWKLSKNTASWIWCSAVWVSMDTMPSTSPRSRVKPAPTRNF